MYGLGSECDTNGEGRNVGRFSEGKGEELISLERPRRRRTGNTETGLKQIR
jgi:hypothetical protein